MTKPDLPKAREAYYKAVDGTCGLLYVADDNPADKELTELTVELSVSLTKVLNHLNKTYNWD